MNDPVETPSEAEETTKELWARFFSVGVKTKLFGLIIGTATISLLAACLTFVFYDRENSLSSKRATLTVLADAVADGAFGPVAFEDEDSAKYILHSIASEETALASAIYLKDGRRLAQWMREGEKLALPDELSTNAVHYGHAMVVRRPIEKDGNRSGEIVAAFSTRDIDERTAQFVRLALSVLLGAVLLATLVVLLSHRVFTVPVKRLSEAAQKVQNEGRFDVRVEPVSNDELGLLTRAFNSMLSAVQNRDEELKAHKENLERLVTERTRDLDRRNQAMRLVLDTVDQGLTTLDLAGHVDPERSAQFDAWFPLSEDGTLASSVERCVPGFQDRFAIAYEQVGEGFFEPEMALDQLPKRMVTRDDKTFGLEYRPIFEGQELSRVLCIVTDLTDQVARERADQEQRQVLAMFEQITKDRAGFIEFVKDADEMVKKLSEDDSLDRAQALRVLHTLKGNCGIFELRAFASLCHEIEEHCAESGAKPSEDDRRALMASWDLLADRANLLLGEVSESISVDLQDYQELLDVVRSELPGSLLQTLVERLSYDPVAPKLERLALQTRRLAKRLGISNLRINLAADAVRLPDGWAWLWALIPHLLRNSVDHGLVDAGKDNPTIGLSVSEDKDGLRVQISDNGRGIEWARLERVAHDRGFPNKSKGDLVRALFADGVSTRSEATETSGRGVGMAAVAHEVRSRGGSIEVASEAGKGTTFTLIIPFSNNPVSTDRESLLARSLLPPSIAGRLDRVAASS